MPIIWMKKPTPPRNIPDVALTLALVVIGVLGALIMALNRLLP